MEGLWQSMIAAGAELLAAVIAGVEMMMEIIDEIKR